MLLRFPSALKRTFPDPADPRRLEIEAVADQLGTYSKQRKRIWDELKMTLESEYLPTVNVQVHENDFATHLPTLRTLRIPPGFSAHGLAPGPPSRGARPVCPCPDSHHSTRNVATMLTVRRRRTEVGYRASTDPR